MDEKEVSKVENIIQELENDKNKKDTKINELNQSLSNSIYASQNQDPNLIVYQLEMDNILEKIEHLLRGDVIKEVEGEMVYTSGEDRLKILNEYGVQLIMNTISFYLNRNTILSAYTEDRIFEILADLGEELSDVILCNYQAMGMVDMQKKSRYPMLVLNILHLIESAYNRSISGGERESLRTGRIVTQNEGMGRSAMMNQMNSPMRPSKFSLFNPDSW